MTRKLTITIPLPMPTWNRILAMHQWQRMKLRHLLHYAVELSVSGTPLPERYSTEYMQLIRPSKKNKEAAKNAKNRIGLKQMPRLNKLSKSPETSTHMFRSQVKITVTNQRARLADIDGLSVKAVIDGLVSCGILSDDSPKQVKEVSHRQTKGKEEETIIEIEEWTE